MSMCRVFSCVVGRGCLLWPVHSLGKTLLAFALLHSVFQGQICLLLQMFLDFLLCIPVLYNEKDIFFGVLVLDGGDDRGWDGCMASPIRWTWVWVNSGCWWWTGRPGVLRFMGSQRVGHDWATQLNWMKFRSGNHKPASEIIIPQKSLFILISFLKE